MKTASSGSIPNFANFDDEDESLIETVPIYVTKTNLRSILEQHGAEKLSDLAMSESTPERRQPKESI
ncbi:hypothetical protein D3C81_1933610 [compost metagenome]